MSTYTVKVTESYWFYDVEADDRAQAERIIANTSKINRYDAMEYDISYESEETEDEFN